MSVLRKVRDNNVEVNLPQNVYKWFAVKTSTGETWLRLLSNGENKTKFVH